MDPYEVLGVRKEASEDEIKAAYKELVKKYHPDKYQNNPLADLAEEKLREVNEAYDLLMRGGNTGNTYNQAHNQRRNSQEFNEVRRNIDAGNLQAAESLLNRSQNRNAEWIFLSGMISYRKGWYDDAAAKVQQAVSMEPGNQEYSQALGQMRGVGQGYQNTAYGRGYNNNDDMFCKICGAYMCFDCCCDCI